MGLEHMFPIMTYYTLTVMLFPFLLLLTRVFRVWRFTMGGEERPSIPFSVYVDEAWTYVYQSVSHTMMRKCPEKGRWLGHWLLALGMVMMLTIKVFALRWFQTDNIYPLYNPQRWLGYLAAGFIFYGVGDILVGRVKANKEIYKETRLEDLIFPILLLLTAVSGIAAHIFRYSGLAYAALITYAAARDYRHADAGGRDAIRQLGTHDLSTAGSVFPGGQGAGRAASARRGGYRPCRLT